MRGGAILGIWSVVLVSLGAVIFGLQAAMASIQLLGFPPAYERHLLVRLGKISGDELNPVLTGFTCPPKELEKALKLDQFLEDGSDMAGMCKVASLPALVQPCTAIPFAFYEDTYIFPWSDRVVIDLATTLMRASDLQRYLSKETIPDTEPWAQNYNNFIYGKKQVTTLQCGETAIARITEHAYNLGAP